LLQSRNMAIFLIFEKRNIFSVDKFHVFALKKTHILLWSS
jgi:hypothetical protein